VTDQLDLANYLRNMVNRIGSAIGGGLTLGAHRPAWAHDRIGRIAGPCSPMVAPKARSIWSA